MFRALEKFANVGIELEQLLAFGKAFPYFYPMEITDKHGRNLAWKPASLGLALWFKELLQEIWKGKKDMEGWTPRLALLLGLRPHVEWMTREEAQALSDDNPSVEFSSQQYLDMVLKAVGRTGEPPSGIKFRLALLIPDWQTGEFHYYPRTYFQRAVFLLFRQSWRARVCIECEKYFIADKPSQLYCSLTCNKDAKRKRNLEWWRREGDKWRRGRPKKRKSGKQGGK